MVAIKMNFQNMGPLLNVAVNAMDRGTDGVGSPWCCQQPNSGEGKPQVKAATTTVPA